METLSASFINVNIGLLTLLAAYVLLLKNEKYFTPNRAFLLSVILLPVALLLVPGVHWFVTAPWPPEFPTVDALGKLNSGQNAPVIWTDRSLVPVPDFSLLPALWVSYGSVCLVLLLRFSLRLWQIFRLIRVCRKESQSGVVLCYHSEDIPAFSFFRWVVINQAFYEPVTLREIIEHEKVHARQWHSADIMLADLVRIIFWINPAVRLLKRYITLNLEFAADSQVIAAGVDKRHYQYSLLQHSLGVENNPLVNAFHSSKIKRRIYMMNSTRSTRRNLYRFLLVLPFVGITYLAVSPARAGTGLPTGNRITPQQSGLEGYYQSDKDTGMYVFIQKKAGKLVLKQMWDGQEFAFEEKTALTFYNAEHSFPLVFTKNGTGEITKLLAFDKDTWIKTSKYKEPKGITLTPEQLQRYAGKYSRQNDGHEDVLQLVVKGAGIEVTEMWRNNSFTILPASETDFFGKGLHYPVAFSIDNKGKVTQALIFNQDVWKKM